MCCRRTWFGALWRTGGSSSLPSPRWSSTRIRSSPTTGIMLCWMRATRSGTLMPRSRRHANRWVVFRSVDLLCFILFNSLWLLPLFPYFVTQIINSLQFNIFLQFNNKLFISCYFGDKILYNVWTHSFGYLILFMVRCTHTCMLSVDKILLCF